jgi:hypothetical protein
MKPILDVTKYVLQTSAICIFGFWVGVLTLPLVLLGKRKV